MDERVMPSADTDSATRTDASTGAPGSGSGALEHRIDELLKDVEQSLEALDEVGAPETAPVDDAAGLDVAALSAELDGALREAERVVEAERIEDAAPVAADAPAAGAVLAETAQNTGTLDALDAALADAAVAADGAGDEAGSNWGAGFGTPAKMVTTPTPAPPVVRVETVAQRTPHAEPEPSPIPAMVAHAAEAHGGAQAFGSSGDVAAGTALPALRAPGLVERGLGAVSSPLTLVSPAVRDLIGWVGLWVAFNAACVWVFVLIVGPGASAPDASARSGDGAGPAGVELRTE
jgi:hypothetical protein